MGDKAKGTRESECSVRLQSHRVRKLTCIPQYLTPSSNSVIYSWLLPKTNSLVPSSLSAKSPLFAWSHSFEMLDFTIRLIPFLLNHEVWQVIWFLFLLTLSLSFFFIHLIYIHVTYIILFFLPVEDLFLHYLKSWPVDRHSHRQKWEWYPTGCVRRWLCSRGSFNQQLSWFSSVWRLQIKKEFTI